MDAFGSVVSNIGTSTTFVSFASTFLLQYEMNSILGNVRSLSYITHLMMMDLNYPVSSQIFFEKVFTFVTFDIIPWTEEIYNYIFGWINNPFSPQADLVGYPSCQLIENSGSITIFIVLQIVLLLVYSLVARILKIGRIHDYMRRKLDGFLWAGCNDFLDGIYLTMCFGICINASSIEFSSTGLWINNVYACIFALIVGFGPVLLAKKVSAGWKQPIVTEDNLSNLSMLERGEIEEEEEVKQQTTTQIDLSHSQLDAS